MYHEDSEGCSHEQYGAGLSRAIYNYMHGMCTDWPVSEWFEFSVPEAAVSPFMIEQALMQKGKEEEMQMGCRLVWLGNLPSFENSVKKRKGKAADKAKLVFVGKHENWELTGRKDEIKWLHNQFSSFLVNSSNKKTLGKLAEDYQKTFDRSFAGFLRSQPWKTLRQAGLLLIK